jgi:hypothetical protein
MIFQGWRGAKLIWKFDKFGGDCQKWEKRVKFGGIVRIIGLGRV